MSEEPKDNPMMTTTEQRLVNLTQRMDQTEAALRTFSRMVTIMWVAVACLAAYLIIKNAKAPV